MELLPAARSPADTPDMTEVNLRRALSAAGHRSDGADALVRTRLLSFGTYTPPSAIGNRHMRSPLPRGTPPPDGRALSAAEEAFDVAPTALPE